MTLLIVGRYIGANYGARGIQGERLVRGLAAKTGKLFVISGDGLSVYSELFKKEQVSAYVNEASALTSRMTQAIGRGGFVTDWTRFAAQQAEKYIGNGAIDGVVSLATPVESHLAVRRALGTSGRSVPWLMFFSDVWPPAQMPRPYSRPIDTLINPIHNYYLRELMPLAAVACTNSRAAHIFEKSFRCGHVGVIPHIMDGRTVVPKVTHNSLLYCGTIGKERAFHSLGAFIEASASALNSNGWSLCFVGGDLERLGIAQQREGLMSIPRVNAEEARAYTLGAAAHLVIEADMPVSPFMPSKVAEALEGKGPIMCISPRSSAIRDLYSRHPRFVFLTAQECQSPPSVEAAILKLVSIAESGCSYYGRIDGEPISELQAADQVIGMLGLSNA